MACITRSTRCRRSFIRAAAISSGSPELLKGETPVIYFYTDRPQSVRIGVRFPRGVWTQWYPQAVRVEPLLVQDAESPDRPGIGRICWHADILPSSLVEHRRMMKDEEIPSLPTTSADALWNFARNVDAAYVRCLDGTRTPAAAEYERFLFYRGLGEARLPLRLDARQGGTLAADRESTIGEGIRHRLRAPGREWPRGLSLPAAASARADCLERDPGHGQGPAAGRVHKGHRR